MNEFSTHLFCLLVLVWVPSGEAIVRSLFSDILSLSLLAEVHKSFCGKARLTASSFTINMVDPKGLHTQEHGDGAPGHS